MHWSNLTLRKNHRRTIPWSHCWTLPDQDSTIAALHRHTFFRSQSCLYPCWRGRKRDFQTFCSTKSCNFLPRGWTHKQTPWVGWVGRGRGHLVTSEHPPASHLPSCWSCTYAIDIVGKLTVLYFNVQPSQPVYFSTCYATCEVNSCQMKICRFSRRNKPHVDPFDVSETSSCLEAPSSQTG